jgi:alpha-1,3-rhamnosyltransferase
MHNSLVSVIIPSYNHALYIEECITSVINQDYKLIELIIIDDGSTDISVDKINLLVDVCKNRFLRFKFIARENRGLAQTLNEGLQWCEGEYIQCLASDDLILA